MEVGRLVRPRGNLVDVEVERPRRSRMEVESEARLLGRLPESRRFDRLVDRLDVPAGLEQTSELGMLDEARTRAVCVDDERRRGEVRTRLVAGHRLLELDREPQHRDA